MKRRRRALTPALVPLLAAGGCGRSPNPNTKHKPPSADLLPPVFGPGRPHD